MNDPDDDYINKILWGDAEFKLSKHVPDGVVQTCITSPPYWGLRDYGVSCQIGLEDTPEKYVAKIVEVFREVRRVLKDDGTLWLNLGDSYAGSGRGRDADGTWNPGKGTSKQATNVGSTVGRKVNSKSLHKNLIAKGATGNAWVKPPPGLKPKDLVGIPWLVAFALRADGWYLRSDIIWSKPNPMPESVTDRPTKSHEYLFLLSKSQKYYYDNEAIKEPAIYGDPRKPYAPGQVDGRGNGHDRKGGQIRKSVARGGFGGKTKDFSGREAFRAIEDWRNKRSVWTVATQPFKEAHFATFPTKLIEPCILAGSREGDLILDPFMGSGTVALRAKELARKYVGVELNEKYIKMAEKRISQEVFFQ